MRERTVDRRFRIAITGPGEKIDLRHHCAPVYEVTPVEFYVVKPDGATGVGDEPSVAVAGIDHAGQVVLFQLSSAMLRPAILALQEVLPGFPNDRPVTAEESQLKPLAGLSDSLLN